MTIQHRPHFRFIQVSIESLSLAGMQGDVLAQSIPMSRQQAAQLNHELIARETYISGALTRKFLNGIALLETLPLIPLSTRAE